MEHYVLYIILGLLPDKVKFCQEYIIYFLLFFLLFSFLLSLQSHPLFLPGLHLHVQGKKFGLKSICQPYKNANSE